MVSNIFELYIEKNTHFSGNLNYNDFQNTFINKNILDFESLLVWFEDEKNQNEIENILKKYNIDVNKNLNLEVLKLRKIKRSLKKKVPKLECYDAVGMYDDHA